MGAAGSLVNLLRDAEKNNIMPDPSDSFTFISRLERTFQIDAALITKRDQKWIDDAIASGPETPLTKKDMDAIRDRVKDN